MSYPYRAARFHVGRNARRRRVWVRYQTAPALAAGYALAGFFVGIFGLLCLIEFWRTFHVVLRHFLAMSAGVLQ